MPRKGNFLFVVHKHQATSLHYDFRIEIGAVMPSWSIPKGPTLDPKLKRLAMRTPDHAMEYRNFEGIIPEGQYGAGTVVIWDEGTFNPEVEVVKGEVKFKLSGKKLHGSFALIKIKGFSCQQESWLMIKHQDEYVKVGFDAKTANLKG